MNDWVNDDFFLNRVNDDLMTLQVLIKIMWVMMFNPERWKRMKDKKCYLRI